jgi:hypothetical protein
MGPVRLLPLVHTTRYGTYRTYDETCTKRYLLLWVLITIRPEFELAHKFQIPKKQKQKPPTASTASSNYYCTSSTSSTPSCVRFDTHHLLVPPPTAATATTTTTSSTPLPISVYDTIRYSLLCHCRYFLLFYSLHRWFLDCLPGVDPLICALRVVAFPLRTSRNLCSPYFGVQQSVAL